MLHDTLALAFAALVLWFVVNPRIPTGVMPTAGLGMVFAAAVYSLDDFANPYVALDLALAGVGVALLGLYGRLLGRRRVTPMRRCTDWGALPSVSQPYELSEEEQRRVAGGKRAPP